MKTKIETLKEVSFVLGLVLIGIVIGISYYIAYEAYSSIKSPISWNTREELAIYSAKAEEEQLKTDILVEVGGGGNSGQDESPLSIEDKIRQTFDKDPEIMLAIAKAESKLNPHQESTIDITKDGHPFSYGVFQINLTVHEIEGVQCNKAFQGKNKNAVVIDMPLYKKCVSLAQNEDINIAKAKKIYLSGGKTQWGAYTNKSYLKYL